MDRALVVVNPSESTVEVIREAGKLAEGVNASLVVFFPMSADEYEDDVSILSTIESVEGASYDKNPKRLAQSAAKQYADKHLSDLDVKYEAKGVLVEDDNQAEVIVETAHDDNCDYVFVLGKRRSPTGKALFGDVAQSVVLNFEGRVVVTAE